ncbi:MAG: AAA family ATPase [Planctomycetes bacterium]|nr:AAA family ATPase [Planctomycetota bacterium]
MPPAKFPEYVCSLRVENVRCFGSQEQEIRFTAEDGRPSQWTVLLGDNGTGKTTLLECLLAFELLETQPQDKYGLPKFYLWLSEGIDAHIASEGREETFRLRLETEWDRKLSARNADGKAGVLMIFQQSRSSAQFGWSPEDVVAVPTFYAYGAGRRTGRTSLSNGSSSETAGNLFDDTVNLRNAEEWLLKLDYSASKDSSIKTKQRERFEQVRELLINILPDVSDIRISSPTERRPEPRAEFKTPDGWIPLRWIGYGYQSLVAWVVDFASRMVDRYPRHKDPLKQPAVVLVDEIDLHMHPRWQRKLMNYLSERFPETQFIVTAHSPIFVQAASGANIVVLRRDKEKGHVVIDNKPEAIRGWRLDQLLTSDLFGLQTARPPELEPLLLERTKLLSKPKLTKADQRKLSDLEKKIGVLPGGETAQDAKTAQLLDRTLDALERQLEEQS